MKRDHVILDLHALFACKRIDGRSSKPTFCTNNNNNNNNTNICLLIYDKFIGKTQIFSPNTHKHTTPSPFFFFYHNNVLIVKDLNFIPVSS